MLLPKCQHVFLKYFFQNLLQIFPFKRLCHVYFEKGVMTQISPSLERAHTQKHTNKQPHSSTDCRSLSKDIHVVAVCGKPVRNASVATQTRSPDSDLRAICHPRSDRVSGGLCSIADAPICVCLYFSFLFTQTWGSCQDHKRAGPKKVAVQRLLCWHRTYCLHVLKRWCCSSITFRLYTHHDCFRANIKNDILI